jgi:hypothetical protein
MQYAARFKATQNVGITDLFFSSQATIAPYA